ALVAAGAVADGTAEPVGAGSAVAHRQQQPPVVPERIRSPEPVLVGLAGGDQELAPIRPVDAVGRLGVADVVGGQLLPADIGEAAASDVPHTESAALVPDV